MNYLLAFLLPLAVTLVVTPLVRRVALHYGIMDRPDLVRKLHHRPVAYLGGLAIFGGFLVGVAVNVAPSRPLAGLLAGATILLLIGAWDDVHPLNPWVKLAGQVGAALVAMAGGIGIVNITNPLGGQIALDWGRVALSLGPLHFHLMPLANALTLLWIVGLVNAINFLDGLDGLAAGVSGIAAFIMFLLAVSPSVNSPQVALLAIILAGACAGFLRSNFFPARIFMGDSGAYFLGLTLALLAIYSGGKLATLGLVLGFTILDGLWVVGRRLRMRISPFQPDRLHLHLLLVDIGLSQRETVLALYAVALGFGAVALMSGTVAKVTAFLAMALVVALTIKTLMVLARRRVLTK